MKVICASLKNCSVWYVKGDHDTNWRELWKIGDDFIAEKRGVTSGALSDYLKRYRKYNGFKIEYKTI